MKRLWLVPVIFAVGWLSYPALSSADYVIHLKSGRQFVTDRYWEEGGEIKFHFKDGVFGVPKAAVVSIEDVSPEAPAKEEALPEKALPEEKEETKAVKKTEKKKEKKAEQARPLHEYWEQKKALKVKLDEALERLRDATRNKDRPAKKQALEEVRKLSKEIYGLTDQVKEMNNGKLPDYWWQD